MDLEKIFVNPLRKRQFFKVLGASSVLLLPGCEKKIVYIDNSEDNSNEGDNSNSGNQNNDSPIHIQSVGIGKSTNSIDGDNGFRNVTIFPGNTGYIDIEMDDWRTMDKNRKCFPLSCGDTFRTVWLQADVSGSVERYEWEILNWENKNPCGGLDNFDRVVDIDINNGKYIVQTNGNKIRYNSPAIQQITGCHRDIVEVTAWASRDKFATGAFIINIRPFGWDVGKCRA